MAKAKTDKLNTGLVMVPFYSVLRIAAIFVEGLRYGRDNWKKGVNDKEFQEERLEHALLHLIKYKEGDTTEDHLAKVAWFCVTQMELTRLENLLVGNGCSTQNVNEWGPEPEQAKTITQGVTYKTRNGSNVEIVHQGPSTSLKSYRYTGLFSNDKSAGYLPYDKYGNCLDPDYSIVMDTKQ
jgi:hypothetical protein